MHQNPTMKRKATLTSPGFASWVLDWIERAGNRLPDPITLFIGGAILVMVLSQIAVWQGWSVEKVVSAPVTAQVIDSGTGLPISVFETDARGEILRDRTTGEPVTRPIVNTERSEQTGGTRRETTSERITAIGLFTRDGLNWAIASMVRNFVGFAPLGIVLVGMLGIGVAERTGAIHALLKAFTAVTPARLLTPSMVFVGIMSSMASDAGYIVLPPIAAALFKSMGRSPLVGLAAVFSGLGAGFSANLFVTGLDPLLSGLTTEGAQILDAGYVVAPTCNWWFMIVSTLVLTLLGWGVTAVLVEPRYERKSEEDGGRPMAIGSTEGPDPLTGEEKRGLAAAAVVLGVTLGVVFALMFISGAPLNSSEGESPRWVGAIVPLLFFVFLLPGLAYGVSTRAVKSDKDVAKMMAATMAAMGPYIVMAFFAAQFIAYFKHSHLGEMLAIWGGTALAEADLPRGVLLAALIAVVMIANLFIGSASAKYAFFAPVFVPIFMRVGISPELTQAAYRVGDSVSNTIAPLNPYIIVLLVFMRQYVPKAGIGTLVSLMLPYTIVFGIVWTLLLLGWVALGIELGPAGPLTYQPPF
jgi:aminobenzoyl-glutamate transport protein